MVQMISLFKQVILKFKMLFFTGFFHLWITDCLSDPWIEKSSEHWKAQTTKLMCSGTVCPNKISFDIWHPTILLFKPLGKYEQKQDESNICSEFQLMEIWKKNIMWCLVLPGSCLIFLCKSFENPKHGQQSYCLVFRDDQNWDPLSRNT